MQSLSVTTALLSILLIEGSLVHFAWFFKLTPYIFPFHTTNEESAIYGRSALSAPKCRAGCRAGWHLRILRVPWTPLTHHEGGLPRYHEAAFARPHRRGSYRRRTWALSNRGGRPNAPRIPIWPAILPADTGARPSRPRERIVGNPELT